MFPSGYFPGPNGYFPADYFPHGVSVRPSYFSHSVFSVNFYPDPYFPGAPLVVVPPIPPEPPTEVFVGGGRFQPRRLPREVVHALVRLALPQPRIQVRAEYLPPTIDASVLVEWAYALERLQATASPADVSAAIQAAAPWVDVEQLLVEVFRPRPIVRRSDDEQLEEDLLLEHYMLSLKDYQ